MLHLPRVIRRTMDILLPGLLLFLAPHLLREFGLRQAVKNRLSSEAQYRGLYSLITVAGLGLIIWGKSVSSFQMIWQPPFEWRSFSLMLMIPALPLLVAGNLPLSYLRKYFRNPMLVGILLWSLAHLWSNGDLASMLLFGSFAIWSATKIISLARLADVHARSPSLLWDIVSIVGGLGLYALIAIYHGQLFGVGLSLV